MPSEVQNVEKYLTALPKDQHKTITTIRKVILKNLPKGYEEGIQWRMPSYFVPLSEYPSNYNCQPDQPLPFVGFASQKNHITFYKFYIYIDEVLKDRFVED